MNSTPSDPSFGIAFICGRSFIEIRGVDRITYPPAYLHLNGVHEKGELVRFAAEGTYDAREGFGEGDCLLHPAGVGHGGDAKVLRHFVCKALVAFALRNVQLNEFEGKENQNVNALSALVDEKQFQTVQAMKEWERQEMVRAMYSASFEDVFVETLGIEANVRALMDRVISGYLAMGKKEKGLLKYQVLGMPPGIGYLLVECRHAPKVRRSRKGGTFGTMKKVSYGVDVATLIDSANVCLKRLASGAKGIRSTL